MAPALWSTGKVCALRCFLECALLLAICALSLNATVPSYPSAVLADHPVVYYRFGESTGGVAADSSGNDHAASYLGGITFSQPGALVGNSDTSIGLDGSTGYVNTGINLLSASSTIEAWVFPTTQSGNPSDGLGQEIVAGMSASFQLGYGQSPGYIRVWLWPAGGSQYGDWQSLGATSPLPLNQWSYIVATWDDGTKQLSLYINGSLNASATLPGVVSSVQNGYEGIPFTIGSFGAYGQWFAGGLDEVAYYNYALSPQQVNAHYLAGTTSTPTTITCTASPNLLWPPDKKLVPVTLSVDVSGSLASLNLVSATSNEPDSGQGDIQGFVAGTASFNGQLRAQRLASGKGRIYTLNYSGLDTSGNRVSCTATVSVPHDQSQ